MPETNQWRFIEVGRLVLITKGKYENKVATILDVVDQNRVLVDSPALKDSGVWTGVPRHVASLKDLEPTPVTTKIQRGLRVGGLVKELEAQNTIGKWSELAWAKKITFHAARANINDFDRFRVDRARRQRAFCLRKKFAEKLTKAGKEAKAKKAFKA
eukprot:TRINITY_DN21268_c0_g3_i1.p2 TRINITY_DN21268_c0_g3~~TRINITY_DN21268_c0_g3_i1.p2  ORF type:complete len:157 (+),score=53.13 TRINITY_DN21268_c0_g3_i1:55-525(+)